MPSRLVAASLALLLLSCSSAPSTQSAAGDGWRWLAATEDSTSHNQGDQLGTNDDLEVIWNSTSEWDTQQIPEVDFGREGVIVVRPAGALSRSECASRVLDVSTNPSGEVRVDLRREEDADCHAEFVDSTVLLAIDQAVFGPPPYTLRID